MNFALNSLRIAFGRAVKLTPRQRMREAKIMFDEGEDGDYEHRESVRDWQGDAILNEAEAYFDVAWYVAYKEVEQERDGRRRRLLRGQE